MVVCRDYFTFLELTVCDKPCFLPVKVLICQIFGSYLLKFCRHNWAADRNFYKKLGFYQ